ncbi:hypothetical protein J437_LFUL011191 [Ladona fulva]|uniref:Uncharacterized protein n=1 Tax=Ladona fulva TaxID=123851 RepID=A0A8K0KMR4_LADFU|nr:hypothetical protein J437_LFUL011191 [Ladona fulva]
MSKDKAALLDVGLFIMTSYVKPWLKYILAVKAPYQDLCLLKLMKAYEKIDKSIAKVTLRKIGRHLWYLTDEVSVLSLFDDDVNQETKVKMVENLTKRIYQLMVNITSHRRKNFAVHCMKNIYSFISVRSNSLFNCLKINDSSLHQCPTMWSNNASFQEARKKV